MAGCARVVDCLFQLHVVQEYVLMAAAVRTAQSFAVFWSGRQGCQEGDGPFEL